MGSAQSLIKCPQCKFREAIYEVQTNYYEETVFCPKCGYSLLVTPRIDRKKSAQDAENRKWYLKKKDGKLSFFARKKRGYGMWDIIDKDPPHIGRIGSMPKDEQKRIDFIKELKKAKRKGYGVKATIVIGDRVKRIL
jgi:DNA-directed RNA polymerase subunit RPC12/RpoP